MFLEINSNGGFKGQYVESSSSTTNNSRDKSRILYLNYRNANGHQIRQGADSP